MRLLEYLGEQDYNYLMQLRHKEVDRRSIIHLFGPNLIKLLVRAYPGNIYPSNEGRIDDDQLTDEILNFFFFHTGRSPEEDVLLPLLNESFLGQSSYQFYYETSISSRFWMIPFELFLKIPRPLLYNILEEIQKTEPFGKPHKKNKENLKKWNYLTNSGDPVIYKILLRSMYNIKYIPEVYLTENLQRYFLNGVIDGLFWYSSSKSLSKIDINYFTKEVCLGLVKSSHYYIEFIQEKGLLDIDIAKEYIKTCIGKHNGIYKYLDKRTNTVRIPKEEVMYNFEYAHRYLLSKEYSYLWPKIKRIKTYSSTKNNEKPILDDLL